MYFWQRWALKWIHFPVFVYYNISMMAIFGASYSTPVGDEPIRPLTFLYRIQCSTTFTSSIFGSNAYFWQPRALKWIYFAVFVPYNFTNMAIFRAPSSTPGRDRRMRPGLFCTEFSVQQLLFEAFLDIYMRILAVLRLKVNLFCCFCILTFTFFACFKDDGHWVHFDTLRTYII